MKKGRLREKEKEKVEEEQGKGEKKRIEETWKERESYLSCGDPINLWDSTFKTPAMTGSMMNTTVHNSLEETT